MRTSNIAVTTASALLAAGVLAFGRPAVGAGYQINEHGAIGTGRCGAFIGTANQPSAIFHNPAGLTRTEGTQFMGGLNLILPSATYVGRGRPVEPTPEVVRQNTESFVAPVPYAFVSHALSKNAFVGLGFYNHYGLTTRWDNPDEFVGRTLIQELSLRTFYLTPTVALKLTESVRVAVGVSLVPATVSLTRVIGAEDNGQVLFPSRDGGPEGSINIEGSAFGVGATAGLQADLTENLRLGFTFRSAIDLSFEGDADFTLPEDTPASVAANFPDQSIDGDLTLPHTFGLGLGWVAADWNIELAAQLTLWSAFDELRFNFDTGRPTPTSVVDRDWEASVFYRLGGEYRFDRFKVPAAIRFGFGYDVTPIPDRTADPTLPSNSRILGTFGAGYDFGLIRADFAYMILFVLDREITPSDENVTFPPTTDMDTVRYEVGPIHLISLSVGVAL